MAWSLSALLRTKAEHPGVGEPPTANRSGLRNHLHEPRAGGRGLESSQANRGWHFCSCSSVSGLCLPPRYPTPSTGTSPAANSLTKKVEISPRKCCTAQDEAELASQLLNQALPKECKLSWVLRDGEKAACNQFPPASSGHLPTPHGFPTPGRASTHGHAGPRPRAPRSPLPA